MLLTSEEDLFTSSLVQKKHLIYGKCFSSVLERKIIRHRHVNR